MIADDESFENVVASGEIIGNSVKIKTLQPGKTYYLKVTAKNTARKHGFTKDNKNGVIVFNTSSKGYVNKELCQRVFNMLSEEVSSTKAADERGCFNISTIGEVRKALSDASKVLANPNATQKDIDGVSKYISEYYRSIDSYRNSGYVALEFKSNDEWYSKTPLKTKYLTDGSVYLQTDAATNITLKKKVPNTDVIRFKSKIVNIRDWNAYALKVKDPTLPVYSDNCYYVAIKDDIFELQRKGAIIETAPNNGVFKENTWYDIEFGCVTIKKGVNLLFKINGETIFDYYDASNDAEFGDGYFAISTQENSQVCFKETEDEVTGLFEPSQKMLNTIKYGETKTFAIGDECFEKLSGTWIEMAYEKNSDAKAGELVCEDKDSSIRCTMTATGDTTYKVMYWNHPSPENDDKVKVTLVGKDGTYETVIDMTKGEEGYVDLGTFKFVSDDAAIGITSILFEGSGKGKLPISSVMIGKVDGNDNPDMLTASKN